MALVGQGAYTPDKKLFHDDTQTWDANFTPDTIPMFCGQGFQFPVSTSWINKPGGSSGVGMVMGFPRSAEPQPNQDGAVKWYVSES